MNELLLASITILFVAMIVSYVITRRAMKQYEAIIVDANNKRNYVGKLTLSELDKYLSTIVAMTMMISVDAYVSDKDRDSDVKLYAYILPMLINYIPVDVQSSIERVYGHNYILSWIELRYMYLESVGIVTRIINKTIPIHDLIRALAIEEKNK